MGQTLRLLVGERGLYETRTQARGEAWLVVSPTGALQILALALTLLAALSALQLRLGSRCRRDVPLVGARSVFEFRLILDWRFLVNAKGVLDEGWSRYKDRPFRIARNNEDITVVPPKYADEIRALPSTVANLAQAQVHNLLGHLNGFDLILHSDLIVRVIKLKLNPNLHILTDRLWQEVQYALPLCFPVDQAEQWTAVRPDHALLGLVSRISSAIFVGQPLCRQDEWLKLSVKYTENFFTSMLLLRLFPVPVQRVLHMLLPQTWQNWSLARRAQRLLIPVIKSHQQHLRDGTVDPTPSLMYWTAECAGGSEQDVYYLARLQLLNSLVSLHTTQLNTVHILLDLAAHPEYLKPLRDEIAEVARIHGKWTKPSLSKLVLLDSFMKESQRMGPPSMLSYQRFMKEAHVLSDGTLLPQGSHLCMAATHVQREAMADPDNFDPFRFARMRKEQDQSFKHQYTTTTRDELHFGHGKYACPGRFFSSMEIKLMLIELVMNYDFKLKDGEKRPENLRVYEFIFPDPKAEILMKKRSP